MAGGKRAGYKLATYRTSEGPRAGIIIGDAVFDAAKLTGKAAYATVAGILADRRIWRSRPPLLLTPALRAGAARSPTGVSAPRDLGMTTFNRRTVVRGE